MRFVPANSTLRNWLGKLSESSPPGNVDMLTATKKRKTHLQVLEEHVYLVCRTREADFAAVDRGTSTTRSLMMNHDRTVVQRVFGPGVSELSTQVQA